MFHYPYTSNKHHLLSFTEAQNRCAQTSQFQLFHICVCDSTKIYKIEHKPSLNVPYYPLPVEKDPNIIELRYDECLYVWQCVLNSIIGDWLKGSHLDSAIWSNVLTILVNEYLFAETEEKWNKFEEDKQMATYNEWKSKPIRKFGNRGGDFQIHVKTMSCKTLWIWVDNDDTIARVKEKIWLLEGYEIPTQKLIMKGKVLDNDHKTVSDYNFQREQCLYLFVRFRGGD